MKKENKDTLGSRMKEFYEVKSQTYLLRRTPVIIRVDGKSFHTFCKRFTKPYDQFLNDSLNNTLRSLCSNIQCVKMGQRHSDEMSLVLTDYDTLTTEPFFEYNVQKICSVVASMVTAEFCKQLVNKQKQIDAKYDGGNVLDWDENWPTFDCRCFNIPEEEIANYFYWRILDAKRNSINMNAQSLFSHKELQGKTCNDMQEMMFSKHGINWDKLPQEKKVGNICVKKTESKIVYTRGPSEGNGMICKRNVWVIEPAPKLKSELDSIVKSLPLVSVPNL